MKTIIQKTTASIFLLLVFTPLFVAFSFTIGEAIIQYRMRQKLESHDLQTVTVPENEVRWMDDHEIWVNNSMFDIRTKKLENGVYTFTGMYDSDETELVKKQQKQPGSPGSEEKLLQQIFHCLRHLYTEPEMEPVLPAGSFSETSTFIRLGHSQFIPPILAPPPRVFQFTC